MGGSDSTLKADILRLKTELDAAVNSGKSKDEAIKAQKEEIDKLQKTIREQNTKIDELKKLNESLRGEIAELHKKMDVVIQLLACQQMKTELTNVAGPEVTSLLLRN